MIISDDFQHRERSHRQQQAGSNRDVRVYIARYDYNPFEGPNNCPELELFLQAGEYVYVSGTADQDGFYLGETTDGRRGLVPGNYLELVPNLAAPPYRLRDDGHMAQLNDLSAISTDSPVGGAKCSELFELDGKAIVPFPRQLRVDKRLQHSLLISWVAPRLSGEEHVEEYRIDVNEQLKTIVDGEKSSAVVENIHEAGTYRISVSAVLADGVNSDPLRCTLLYGNDLGDRTAPIALRLEAINSAHCVISWLPVNSNFRHRVCVSGIERETLPAGFYMTRINQLDPDRQYIITVEPISSHGSELKVTNEQATIKVRTRPPGPPDPPQSPVIEDDTLNAKNVTIRWLPVTLTGTSNGTPIRGYCVYQNGKSLDEVLNPSGDRISVLRSQIKAGSKITVRTITMDGEVSVDSGPAKPHTANKVSHVSKIRNRLRQHNMTTNPYTENSNNFYDNQSRLRSPTNPTPAMHLPRNRASHSMAEDFNMMNLASYNYNNRPRIRSADFEQENEDWLRHTIDRHQRNVSDETWNRSIDRRRAHSMPRKVHLNQGVGLLDGFPDMSRSEQPRSRNTMQRSAIAPSVGSSHSIFDYDMAGDPNAAYAQQQQSRICYGKEPPNVFDRLRNSEQYSDYMFSDSGSLSSISSWGRRSPTRSRKQRPQPNKASNSYSMNDINFHQLSVFHPPTRGRSPDAHRRQTRTRARKDDRCHSVPKTRRSSLPRLFVALYDYDPISQSPNEDAAEVELSFREGQLIKIYGEKDEDGFFKGAIKGGRRGLVPCNMIAQVDVPDGATMEALYSKGFLTPETSTGVALPKGSREHALKSQNVLKHKDHVRRNGTYSASPQSEKSQDSRKQKSLKEENYVAAYNYNPSTSSPNIDKDEELQLKKGDLVKVLSPLDDDGFFYAEVNGRKGFVPSNYLSKLNADSNQSPHFDKDPRNPINSKNNPS